MHRSSLVYFASYFVRFVGRAFFISEISLPIGGKYCILLSVLIGCAGRVSGTPWWNAAGHSTVPPLSLPVETLPVLLRHFNAPDHPGRSRNLSESTRKPRFLTTSVCQGRPLAAPRRRKCPGRFTRGLRDWFQSSHQPFMPKSTKNCITVTPQLRKGIFREVAGSEVQN